MPDILSFISSLDNDETENNKYIQDLLVNKTDIPFDKDEVERIQTRLISLVNKQLNQSATRHNGLKLLLQVLPRCSKETLSKHAVLWLAKASHTLDIAQSDNAQITIAAKIIAHLVILCKEIPELQKQISMQTVKQLIGHVNGLSSERRYGAVYYLISVLMYHYPEPCEKQQATIRKLILPLIDSAQENLVRAGANCYALLVLATERSFKLKDNKSNETAWTHGQSLLCNSLHETMDGLFNGITELEHVEVDDVLPLPAISQSEIMEYYLSLELRFNNLCIFLITVLGGCGPRNSVSPSNILKVVRRGLSITPAGLGNENSFTKQILQLILPKLHANLLRVLDALIFGFRKDLIPYSRTILKLVQRILTWTETVPENTTTLDGSKSFKSTRCGAYKTLTSWLLHTGASSGIDYMCDEFLSHIIRDVVPPKDSVSLTIQSTTNLSKRSLKRHRESQYNTNLTETTTTRIADVEVNADLIEEALKALENIFLSTGCRLKRSFHETSQAIILAQLYDCYLETRKQTVYVVNRNCRLQLLKTLKALHLNPHYAVPPPIQHALQVFQMAQFDADLRIIQEAKVALTEIEKIVHPAAPTLRLPLSDETVVSCQPADQQGQLDTVMESVVTFENMVQNPNNNDGSINTESNIIKNTAERTKTNIATDPETTATFADVEMNVVPNKVIESEVKQIENSDNEEDVMMPEASNKDVRRDSIGENGNSETRDEKSEKYTDDQKQLSSEVIILEEDTVQLRESPRNEQRANTVSDSIEHQAAEESDNEVTMLNLFCDAVQENE